jgi:hypothetical protein
MDEEKNTTSKERMKWKRIEQEISTRKARNRYDS